jgi:hypothetical protein
MSVMTKQYIIDNVKSLNLPQGSYIVFGAAPLAICNIREANDIELLVRGDTLNGLQQAGWRQIIKGPLD